jgi:membrane protein
MEDLPVARRFAFSMLSYSLIYYYFGPDMKGRPWRWITPGSTVGAFLWLLASEGFRLYVRFFNSYSKTYGSFGTLIILMFWLYVTGLSFLVGGVINAEIERASGQFQR